MEGTDIQKAIMQFFTENPSPSPEIVQEFAVGQGLAPEILEQEIYNLLSSFLTQDTTAVKKLVHDARKRAEKEISVTVKTEDLLDHLVGEVRDYYRNGLFYEHNEGHASIDGREVLDPILDQLVSDFNIGDVKTKISMDPETIHEYMSGSGYRAMDYSLEDAKEDFEEDPLGILSGMQNAFGAKAHPYDYARQTEYWEEEEPGEEYFIEDYEDL